MKDRSFYVRVAWLFSKREREGVIRLWVWSDTATASFWVASAHSCCILIFDTPRGEGIQQRARGRLLWRWADDFERNNGVYLWDGQRVCRDNYSGFWIFAWPLAYHALIFQPVQFHSMDVILHASTNISRSLFSGPDSCGTRDSFVGSWNVISGVASSYRVYYLPFMYIVNSTLSLSLSLSDKEENQGSIRVFH